MTDREAQILGALANHVEKYAVNQLGPDNDEYDRAFIAGLIHAVQMIVEFDVDAI